MNPVTARTLRDTSTTRPGAPARPAPAAPTAGDPYPEFTAGLRRLTGIDLDQYKRAQMERRIRTWIRARHGDEDLLAELGRLRTDDAELDAFLDRMTINVSQLWRNPEQWERLERDVLPELLADDPARLRCWSAGSSYGAEAYTLAAHLVEATRSRRARAEVLGTDIDKRVVARATRGIFSDQDARDAPRAALGRHFTQTPDGTWAASDELRRLVSFEVGDLLRVRPAAGSFDLILCRNTVIYFNEEVRDALHTRLVEALRPGGFLIVGATERVVHARDLGLDPTHPFTYRKG